MSSKSGKLAGNDRQGVYPIRQDELGDEVRVIVHFNVMHNAQKYGSKSAQRKVVEAYLEAAVIERTMEHDLITFDDLVIGESLREATPEEIDNIMYPGVCS